MTIIRCHTLYCSQHALSFFGNITRLTPVFFKYIIKAMADPIFQLFPFLEYFPLPRNKKLQQSVEHMIGLLEGAVNEREKERERDRTMGVDVSDRPPRDLLDLLIPVSKGAS